MKNIFEKRFFYNLNKYKKMSDEELMNYQNKIYDKVYKKFSDDEIFSAELEIIVEDLESEILNKKIDADGLIIYKSYLKNLKNVKKYYNLINTDDLKELITAAQLSLNIKPSFITSLDMNELKDLYDYLENYRIDDTSKILSKKE